MARNFGHEDAGLATPETLSAIVENFAIRTFLETSSKRYLVGPKGSGKTLVLLRKAIDERRRGDSLCIPSDPDLPASQQGSHEVLGSESIPRAERACARSRDRRAAVGGCIEDVSLRGPWRRRRPA